MLDKIRYRVFENPDSASAQVAAEIVQLIRERAALGRTVVLGLAAGPTLQPLYAELIYQHREEALSLRNVITFNLDEYVGLDAGHPTSFRACMQRHFFDHVDIPRANIRFLSGMVSEHDAKSHCTAYEKQITKVGGIDFQVVGIGRSGHLGLNEPGTPAHALTQRIELGELTRGDMAKTSDGLANIPTHALTMGCGTILKARKVALLAWGSNTARVVRSAIQGPVTSRVCASYFQNHRGTQFFLDPPAASVLRMKA